MSILLTGERHALTSTLRSLELLEGKELPGVTALSVCDTNGLKGLHSVTDVFNRTNKSHYQRT